MNLPIPTNERLFIPPFFFIRVPITNLIPSYDSRQGRLRQMPEGHSWQAVGMEGGKADFVLLDVRGRSRMPLDMFQVR